MARFALDAAGHHVVNQGVLEYCGGDRWSAAHVAIARALRVAGDRVELALEDGSTLDVSGGGYRLCPFEIRYAADHGHLHPIPLAARAANAREPTTPITDLHTHYAACLSGEALLALGVAQGVTMPRAVLEAAGVHTEGDTALADLPAGARARLVRSFEVAADKRITFLDMERIYRARSPITKSLGTLPAFLARAAEDYAAQGVRYVELSLGSLADAAVLRAIHQALPAIEDRTGVTIRFLLALSRHNDPEWNEDVVRRLATLGGSLYVAGIDVMGHETNSTHAFAPTLRAIADWASMERPGFAIRVHAGESPSHPENVRVAIEAVRGKDVALRIGHGLYGVDDPTLEAIVEGKVVVEMNLDSNIALNHVASGREAPIRRYLDAGARVVLGSDGYGIYGASPWSAARAALVSGARVSDLETIRAIEEEILEAARARDAPASRSFVVPDDLAPVSYTPEVGLRREREQARRDQTLTAALATRGVQVLSKAELVAHCAGRRVVSVAGAWQHSWNAMSESERLFVEHELATFASALDPREVVVLTGGTRYGVEGFLAPRFPTIGAIVTETPPESLAEIAHAVIVAPSLYAKAAAFYELIDELGGACVFVGGGQIVRDEIQAAKNLGLPYVAFEGPGASGAHAREIPSRAARSGREAAYFAASVPRRRVVPHWFLGANPTVDAVVLRWDRDILLVRRSADAPVEPGAWALPGGFVATDAPRGGPWEPGRETDVEACVRELREETALEVSAADLVPIGVFEGGGRDPRDSERSFSRSTAFLVALEEPHTAPIAGGDDAGDARWFPINALPARLAFDHATIIARAVSRRRPR